MSSSSDKKHDEVKIEELLIKLQVGTNGLIDERKKSGNYLKKIKDFETILSKKDNEIVDLNKDKYDLESKLSQAKHQKKETSIFDGGFTKEKADTEKFNKLKQQNSSLKYELQNISQRLCEDSELYDQQKIKFHTGIALQTAQIKEISENEMKTKNDIQALHRRNEDVTRALNNHIEAKALFSEKLEKIRNDRGKNEKFAVQFNEQGAKKKKEISELAEEIQTLKKSKQEGNKQMTDLKSNKTHILEVKKFKAKVKEDNSYKGQDIVDIVLSKNDKTNFYEIIIENEKKREVLNGINITAGEGSEKKENYIEIKYMESGKSCIMKLKFNELLIDSFVEAYRTFSTKANMEQY